LEDKHKIEFDDPQAAGYVYGHKDGHLRMLERSLGLQVSSRGTVVHLQGEEDARELAANLLFQLYEMVREGLPVSSQDVERSLRILRDDPDARLRDIFLDHVLTSSHSKMIAPKGLNQKRYIDAIRSHDIVFGIGPAGTGKTYLAMAMALGALARKQVRRVVLTRPAVEAGEKLGFLPGDLQEKVSPYLRPLYDALHDMLDFEKAQGLLSRNVIEVAPLAFMRGRTLNNAFVIVDEAQNTTRAQMKMILTRLGFDSKAVITGDITQIDLPNQEQSGLVEAARLLRRVDGIKVCEFSAEDVVRHPLVMKIIQVYEEDDKRRDAATKARADAWGPGPAPAAAEPTAAEPAAPAQGPSPTEQGEGAGEL
jgi:phosphate starvation-inducible PhoH-like protein